MEFDRLLRSRRFCGWLLLVALALTLLPFLGLCLFNTKGEPREAIVALTMLQTDNWILPLNYGDDIQFKPPFLYWCIACLGNLAGGITEYISRLPSALACIFMTMAGYLFYSRRRSALVALGMGVLTFTCFEVIRSAISCRLDMMVTAFIVTAIYCLYMWIEERRRGMAPLAVLLMACGALTKGPVAALLPCLCIGTYGLLRGKRFWPLLGKMLCAGLLALIPLALWYLAAFRQNGDRFMQLMLEENVGRFTGKMSYESHSQPVWYNFVTLVSGLLPYTLLLLFGLFSLKGSRRRPDGKRTLRTRLADMWLAIRKLEPVTLLALTVTVVIFVFYCIPESKRSVYLLPIYPFICYFITLWLQRLCRRGKKSVKAFGMVIGIIAVVAPMAYLLVRLGVMEGIGSRSMRFFITALQQGAAPVWLTAITVTVSFVAGAYAIYAATGGGNRRSAVATAVAVVTIWWAFQSAYQPPMLNAKSDLKMTRELTARYPHDKYYYSYGVQLFTMNYYTSDRVRYFSADVPPTGLVMMNPADLDKFEAEYPGYILEEVWRTGEGERCCDNRRPLAAYRFRAKTL